MRNGLLIALALQSGWIGGRVFAAETLNDRLDAAPSSRIEDRRDEAFVRFEEKRKNALRTVGMAKVVLAGCSDYSPLRERLAKWKADVEAVRPLRELVPPDSQQLALRLPDSGGVNACAGAVQSTKSTISAGVAQLQQSLGRTHLALYALGTQARGFSLVLQHKVEGSSSFCSHGILKVAADLESFAKAEDQIEEQLKDAIRDLQRKGEQLLSIRCGN